MNNTSPRPDLFARIWRACMLLCGSLVLLNLTLGYIRPILSGLIASLIIAFVLWVVVQLIRWRRSRWWG